MTTSHFTSPKGNKVANQLIVHTPEATYFESYGTTIIKTFHDSSKRIVLLDKHYWDYSKTTSKYRNEFLGETTKEIKAKIDSGEYLLIDLN